MAASKALKSQAHAYAYLGVNCLSVAWHTHGQPVLMCWTSMVVCDAHCQDRPHAGHAVTRLREAHLCWVRPSRQGHHSCLQLLHLIHQGGYGALQGSSRPSNSLHARFTQSQSCIASDRLCIYMAMQTTLEEAMVFCHAPARSAIATCRLVLDARGSL